MDNTVQEQELIRLSKTKWQWMAERNVDSLDVLFHAEASLTLVHKVTRQLRR